MSYPGQPPLENARDGTTGTVPNETTYSDPSGPIFNMYNTRAQKLDHENVENWKEGADSILVFVRFHAALTIIVCLQALTPYRLVFSLLRWLPLSP